MKLGIPQTCKMVIFANFLYLINYLRTCDDDT